MEEHQSEHIWQPNCKSMNKKTLQKTKQENLKGDFTNSVSQNCFSFFKNDMEKHLFEISVQKLLSCGSSVLGRVLFYGLEFQYKAAASQDPNMRIQA